MRVLLRLFNAVICRPVCAVQKTRVFYDQTGRRDMLAFRHHSETRGERLSTAECDMFATRH